MSNFIKYLFSTALLLLSIQQGSSQYSADTYLVRFEPGTPQSEIDQIRDDLNSTELDISPISETRLWKVDFFPFPHGSTGQWITDINETEEESAKEKKINESGLNFVPQGIIGSSIPNPNIPNDDQLDCLGQLSTYVSTGDSDVRIGVFDTGLTYFGNPNIPNYFFDLQGYDQWDHLDNDPIAQDDHGHGSHMASIVSHTTNKAYGLGQVPNEPNETYDIRKSFDANGEGYLFEIIDAMEEATVNGMNVASCSWSFKSEESKAYKSPLYRSLYLLARDYGVLVVAAAGNDAEYLDHGGVLKNYPASYDLDNILTATSYNCSDDVTMFANWGETSIGIATPGYNLAGLENDNIVYRSGTSQSTALLAGIAASLGTHQSQFDYQEIICAIMSSAQYHPNVSDKVVSDGLIDANNALNYLGNCIPSGGGPGSGGKSRPSTTAPSSHVHTYIYPNPNSGQYTIAYHGEQKGNLNIELYNLQGKLIHSKRVITHRGQNLIDFNHVTLESGMYHVILTMDQYSEAFKLVIR